MSEKLTVSSQHHDDGFWPSLIDPLRQFGATVANFFSPRADAANTEKHYEINLELPGVKEEDIEITLHDGVLMVKGEKRASREEKSKTFYFSERSYGMFQRSFRVPPDTNPEAIDASYADGVLTLLLPKLEPEKPAARRIEINRDK